MGETRPPTFGHGEDLMKGFTAIFGGSFDPPHLGHSQAVSWLLAGGGCCRVIVIPAFSHAFGKQMAPFEHRLEMCRVAFLQYGDAIEVSDIEATLPTPSFTVNTVTTLHAMYPVESLRLVIGSDILAQTGAWRDFERITAIAPPIVLNRGGFPGAGLGNFPAIASSDLRRKIAGGNRCSDAIDADVMAYIERHGLYGHA